MTDLFSQPPHKPDPVDHYCLICDRVASFGVKLRKLPVRGDGRRRRGDGFGGYAWYCADHAAAGRELLKSERAFA